MTKERLSEDQVRVQIARCPACKKVVLMSVVHLMTKATKKEFMDLMDERCEISQIGLEEARKSEMCFLDCDEPLVASKEVLIEKFEL